MPLPDKIANFLKPSTANEVKRSDEVVTNNDVTNSVQVVTSGLDPIGYVDDNDSQESEENKSKEDVIFEDVNDKESLNRPVIGYRNKKK